MATRRNRTNFRLQDRQLQVGHMASHFVSTQNLQSSTYTSLNQEAANTSECAVFAMMASQPSGLSTLFSVLITTPDFY